MGGRESLCECRPWERHEGVTVVECPSCGFCMDADHEDMEGGYSCPLCQVTRQHLALQDVSRLAEDARQAESYLRHYAEMKQWPRLSEIADLLRALQEAVERGN